MSQTVSFPGLGLSFTLKRSFSFFGLIDIYWYAVIICCGILCGFLYALREGKRQQLPSDLFVDVVLVGLPSAIVGARLYYVLSRWDYYGTHLGQILNIRGGGLAIYGGIIGAALAVMIYCVVKKQKILEVFDICGVSLLIGQGIGRWGNFVNVEAYGYKTNLPWAMQIAIDGKMMRVHPTFLYESIWNLTGAVLLACLMKRKKRDGQIFWLYLIWYGFGRFWIEGLRTDSLMFFQFRLSQMVAVFSVLLGIVMLLYPLCRSKHLKQDVE